MKLILLTITFAFVAKSLNAQIPATHNAAEQKSLTDNSIYKLFPTKNYWTFLKLDTRNGLIWQVQFSVTEDNTRGTTELNVTPLVTSEKEKVGRFTLYPTENIYNFLLLDQINGKVYQVQWSLDSKNRGVIPID